MCKIFRHYTNLIYAGGDKIVGYLKSSMLPALGQVTVCIKTTAIVSYSDIESCGKVVGGSPHVCISLYLITV